MIEETLSMQHRTLTLACARARFARVFATLLVASCLALPAAVHAQDAAMAKAFDIASLLRELESTVALSGGLDLRASKPTVRDGESVVFTVELPRPGYLNVVSINPLGEATVLFPNQFHSDNKVAAGPFILPTSQMNFEFKARAPFGQTRVAAFLTNEPLDLYQKGDGKRDSKGLLSDQFARLSAAGRDLLEPFVTRSLQAIPVLAPTAASAVTPGVLPSASPLAAGMTTVLSCAATGPCDSASAEPTGIRRVIDAVIPGIFFDKASDIPEPKAVLRPVYEPGVRLTKASEGFVPKLYLDPAGYCTIAYGHLLNLGGCRSADRSRYGKGITEPEGGSLLLIDLAMAQRAVMSYVTVELTDGQYAALVDFTFNVGAGNLKRSTLLKAVNAGQHDRVPFQFRRWVYAGGRELRGLRTRREREIALYFQGTVTPKAMPKGEDTTPIDIRSGERGP